PHGFGGGAEEMGPATPRRLVRSRQLQPGFVHQGGRLQSLPRRFVGQLGRRQLAQLVVYQGQQLFGRPGIALFYRLQDARDVVHSRLAFYATSLFARRARGFTRAARLAVLFSWYRTMIPRAWVLPALRRSQGRVSSEGRKAISCARARRLSGA